eukprot:gnl/TRDRNA2_/TRDRNA2_144430_c0_seq1.p1 gnl/TRDRNA2_/TRDRNA2_144430_c0~~gnl/TRDRNA2_/TRDRNA2_144430_c0_seq1.p1  ORF type:complete len:252 (+),score=39.85 gnl/TRDRNA2_/TRDRNA2_144430_c0_seq1:1-756(+)
MCCKVRCLRCSWRSASLCIKLVGEVPQVPDGMEVDILKLDEEYAEVKLHDQNTTRGYVRLAHLSRAAAAMDEEDREMTPCSSALKSLPTKLVVCRTDGIASTLMWQTVGCRGPPWAPGGAVPNGELVTVLGSQVEMSMIEGGFVKVKRPAGHEGFLKIKNLHAPLQEDASVSAGLQLLHCRVDGESRTGIWPKLGEGRGQWVCNIENGELVKVLDGPCNSESEGYFVLVQRHDGMKGWMKIKNMHLPLAEI